MLAEFFDGFHQSFVILVGKIVDFVYLFLGDDESVALSFGVDVKKSDGFIILVDFIAGDFAVDDLSKNARHA